MYVKAPCGPMLTDSGFDTSYGPLVRRDSNRNQNFGQNIENKKFPAASAWYLALRRIMCPDSTAIVKITDLVERKRVRRPSIL